MNKNPERLKILEKIEQYELEGKFILDVEQDPPTIPIKEGEVDYLRKKLSSKIKTKFAYHQARKFLNKIIKNKQMIIKEIKGIENLANLDSGAIITCNHFNAFDSFAIQVAYETCIKNRKKKRFYRVIREGNYTSFPGFYGFLMKNCYTLPLAENKKVMVEFMRATKELLKQGHLVLVYPEQSMWWNYKKPKPLQDGAFSIALMADVPIVPVFITMSDSNILDNDGFYVQEYTINISKPIYKKDDLNKKDNINYLKDLNYNIWKDIYEDYYKIPLKYTTIKENVD